MAQGRQMGRLLLCMLIGTCVQPPSSACHTKKPPERYEKHGNVLQVDQAFPHELTVRVKTKIGPLLTSVNHTIESVTEVHNYRGYPDLVPERDNHAVISNFGISTKISEGDKLGLKHPHNNFTQLFCAAAGADWSCRPLVVTDLKRTAPRLRQFFVAEDKTDGFLSMVKTRSINCSDLFFASLYDNLAQVDPLVSTVTPVHSNCTKLPNPHHETEHTADEEASHATDETQEEEPDDQKRSAKGQGNRKKRSAASECVCHCRMSDRARSGRFKSRSCGIQVKHPWICTGPRACNCSIQSLTKLSDSGRRRRRLLCKPWSVDSLPNPTGQAKRQNLTHHGQKVDTICSKRNGQDGKHIVELLLMSAFQRTGKEGSGWRNIVEILLVSVRILSFLLGDHRVQMPAGHDKRRLLPLLLQSFGTDSCRTLSVYETVKTVFNSCYSINAESSERTFWKVKFSTQVCNDRQCPIFPSFLKMNGFQMAARKESQLPKSNTEFCHHTNLWVAPATGFLPSVTSRDGHFLDHTGYRLASLAALPASCNLSRVRLAEAGFHYDPRANSSAVVCHRCGAAYSVQPSSGQSVAPLEFHQSQSPQCPFLNSLLETYSTLPSSSASQLTTNVGSTPSSASGSLATATMAASFASRQVGGPSGTDGTASRGLAVDCDAAGPGLTTNWPSADSHRPSQRSQASTGCASPLAISSTHQQNTPDVVPSSLSSRQQQQSPGAPSVHQARDDQDRDERPQLSLGNAVYPQFSTTQSRLATFRNWPLNAIFPPHILVALGFYYAGYADCVRCFFCGVGLKSWDEQDDVLTEHIRWRPNCLFLLATKGRRFIQNTLNRIGNVNSPNASDTSPTSGQRGIPSHSQGPTSNNVPTRSSATNTPPTTTSSSSSQGGSSSVLQQLVTMGFSSEDITRVQARLRSAGESCDLDHMLEHLFP